MTTPRDYELSDEQLDRLKEASKGGLDGALAVWDALGEEMGFKPGSVRPIQGKPERFFTAGTHASGLQEAAKRQPSSCRAGRRRSVASAGAGARRRAAGVLRNLLFAGLQGSAPAVSERRRLARRNRPRPARTRSGRAPRSPDPVGAFPARKASRGNQARWLPALLKLAATAASGAPSYPARSAALAMKLALFSGAYAGSETRRGSIPPSCICRP